MSLASAERAALSDLLDEVGPDASTLCEGWATRDLAAHLVIREGRPDANAGIVIPQLRGRTERIQAKYAAGDYASLVERVRSGPPTLSPFNLPGVDANANGFEYLVHHEDVRRAQDGWKPRELPDKVVEAVWARLTNSGGKFIFRKARTGVTLEHPDGRSFTVKAGEPMVTLVGHPIELVMYGFGRGAQAHVEVVGDAVALEAFAAGSFRI